MASSVINNPMSGRIETLVTGMTVTIPNGQSSETETTIDISNLVPSGKTLVSAMCPRIGSYVMPYVTDGNVKTYVFSCDIRQKNIVIKNRSTIWSNMWLELVLFLR